MLKIGHRGASAHAPENTLTAFRLAIAMGADGVELDVHRCKSGELVVIHDDTVDRTTNGKGAVVDMTLEQLRALRITPDESIPTLEEALASIKGNYCFIEIKHSDAAFQAAALMKKEIASGWPAERLWLISFQHEALTGILQKFPEIYVGMSYEALNEFSLRDAHRLNAKAIVPQHKIFTENQVKEAKSLDIKVIGWTANDSADIARLVKIGVDGIMTDYPEIL